MPEAIENLQTSIPGAENPGQVSCKIFIEGAETDAGVRVQSVQVNRFINRLPSATIVLADGEVSRQTFETSDSDLFVPGKKIEIALGYQTQSNTVFKGIVVSQSNTLDAGNSELVVVCQDEAVKMTLQKKYACFNDMAASEAAEQIIGKYSLENEIEETNGTIESLVQFNQTDWDFVMQLLDNAGLICLLEDGVFHARKPDLQQQKSIDVIYGATLMNYTGKLDARLQAQETVFSSWNPDSGELEEVNAAEPDLQESGNLTATGLAEKLSHQKSEFRFPYKKDPEVLQAQADAWLQKQRLSKIRARIRFQGTPQARPGTFIEAGGIGARFSGPLFVSGITHIFEKGNWLSEATLGTEPNWFVEEVNPWQPESGYGHLPMPGGLFTAVVLDNEDPTGNYRVRVWIPAVFSSPEGVWARVATLDAGDGRGTFFRPEIDDELIVGFEGNNPDYPVVLGMLHSSRMKAPLEPANDNHEKGYRSRSGFTLIFHDAKKTMTIESPAQRKIAFDDDAGQIIISDKSGNTITIEDGKVKINSASDLEIKATSSIKLDAPQIKINATGQLELKGSMVNIN